MISKNYVQFGIIYAIASALLFGASIPIAKYLLSTINPWLLAGLFYLGSGVGIGLIQLVRLVVIKNFRRDKLKSNDLKWLFLATFFGGIIGPIFLMFGIKQINAASSSLLLNLESIFTALIAWSLLKEHTSLRLIIGMILIVVGGIILTWSPDFTLNHILGPLFIAAACLAWAIDNNLTRHISASDTLKIVSIKSLLAGAVNTVIGLVLFPAYSISFTSFSLGLIVGFMSYGLSLICFILALRNMGTARTSAYFSLAPFIGAIFSIIFLREALTLQFILASIFMGWGVWLHLSESHEHEHFHEELIHSHLHIHDEHHQHEHLPTDPSGEPHTHLHKHTPLIHSHPHYPDIHHRHSHKVGS